MKSCTIPLTGLIEFNQAEEITLRVRLALRGGVTNITFSCDESTHIQSPEFIVFLEGVRRQLGDQMSFSGVRGHARRILSLFNFEPHFRG
ncbi:MAG: hypothetical protein RL095_1540 [Verrucomicrobiota bacterium]|jgi:hypothetical protein